MSVLSLVADPAFQKLIPADQQATLNQMDSGFGGLNPQDFAATVGQLQKQALSRPDLVAPPSGVTKPRVDIQPLLPNGQTATTYQAAPQEQTQAGHDAAIRRREDTSNLGTVGNTVAQTGIGFAKGAGDTLEHSVGKLIPGTTTTDTELESTNGWQTAGKAGEGIMEFVAGDEALKGLSIAERLGLASKLAKLAESHPAMSKIITAGLNAVRQGTVGAGQTFAKGASAEDALKSGAEVGGVGLGLGALGEALPAATRKLFNKVMPEDVRAAEVQQGVANVAKSAADSAAEIKPTASDPYGFRQLAAEQIGRYKSAAQRLDELSNNAFSEAQQAVEDSSGDFTTGGRQAARAAEQQLNGVVEQYRPQLEANGINVDEMKDSYRAGIANRKIANFLSSTVHEVGKGADELTARVKSGPQLKERILDLAQNQKDLLGKAGWTPGHINQAVQFARKMDTGATNNAVGIVGEILKHKLGLGGVGALAGAYEGYKDDGLSGIVTGSAKGAALGTVTRVVAPYANALLWKIISTPSALRLMNSGVEPKTIAPLVAEEVASDAGFMARLKEIAAKAATPAAANVIGVNQKPTKSRAAQTLGSEL